MGHRPWNRKCDTCGTCECRSLTDSTDTSQWRYHNFSCRTKASKLMRHCTRNGTVLSESHWSTSRRTLASVAALTERTSSPDCHSRQMQLFEYIRQRRTADGLLYLKFCGQAKHILLLSVCLQYTTVSTWLGIILVLTVNMCIQSTSSSVRSWAWMFVNIILGHHLPHDRLTAQGCRDFTDIIPLRLCEVVPLAVKPNLRF